MALAAIVGAVGGTLVVIVIATVGAILVLILVMKTILIRRIPQHQDTLSNKKGITMDNYFSLVCMRK